MRFMLIVLIRAYRYFISPLLPARCIYEPTCSRYAMDAIARFGVIRGLWLALLRLLRCHPFTSGGYDPVPEPHHHYPVHKTKEI